MSDTSDAFNEFAEWDDEFDEEMDVEPDGEDLEFLLDQLDEAEIDEWMINRIENEGSIKVIR